MQVSNHPFAATYSLTQQFSFHLEENHLFAHLESESWFFLNNFPVLFPTDGPQATLPLKKRFKKMLQEGYRPVLNDRKVTLLLPTQMSQITPEVVIETIEKAIDLLRVQIILQMDHPGDYLCPLSLELLNEPVIDPCGHTFEKAAIEKCIVEKGEKCPASGLPLTIEILKPNLSMKSLVANIRSSSPLILMGVMNGKNVAEDRNKAERFIKMALELIAEGAFEEALGMFKKAFEYTNRSQDFLHIPAVYIKAKEPQKAALAYLYLAKLQLQEKLIEEAEASLKEAFQIDPESESIKSCYAWMLKYRGKRNQATTLYFDLGCQFALEATILPPLAIPEGLEEVLKPGQPEKSEKLVAPVPPPQQDSDTLKKAFAYFHLALSCQTDSLVIYGLIEKYADEEMKVRLYMTGFLAFFNHNREAALTFHEKARLMRPWDPNILLTRLAFLEKNNPEKRLLQRQLAQIFSSEDNQDQAGFYLKKAAKSRDPLDLEPYFQHLLRESQRSFWRLFRLSPEKEEEAERLLLGWIKQEEGERKDPLIERALNVFGRKAPFLELLLERFLTGKEPNTSIESLILELGALYETHQDFEAAIRIYRIGFDRFNHFDASFKLAELIEDRDSTESQRIYTLLSKESYLKGDHDHILLCQKKISDATASHLQEQERHNLVTQNLVASLFMELKKTQISLRQTEERLIRAMEELKNVRATSAKATSVAFQAKEQFDSGDFLKASEGEELKKTQISLRQTEDRLIRAMEELKNFRTTSAEALSVALQAREHFDLGEFKEAVEGVEKALKLDPNQIVALSVRGQLALRTKNYEAAYQDLDLAVRLDPQQDSTRMWLAYTQLQRKQVFQTCRELDLIFEKNPTWDLPELILSSIHNLPVQDNIEVFLKLFDFWEGGRTTLFSLAFRGKLYTHQLVKALESDPKNTTKNSSGLSNREPSEHNRIKELALKDLNLCLKLRPDWNFPLALRGNLLRLASQIRSDSEDSKKAHLSGFVSNILGQYSKERNSIDLKELALKDLNQAIQLNPHDAFSIARRGVLTSSIRDFAEAIKINPNCTFALYQRAQRYLWYLRQDREFHITKTLRTWGLEEQNHRKTLELNFDKEHDAPGRIAEKAKYCGEADLKLILKLDPTHIPAFVSLLIFNVLGQFNGINPCYKCTCFHVDAKKIAEFIMTIPAKKNDELSSYLKALIEISSYIRKQNNQKLGKILYTHYPSSSAPDNYRFNLHLFENKKVIADSFTYLSLDTYRNSTDNDIENAVHNCWHNFLDKILALSAKIEF